MGRGLMVRRRISGVAIVVALALPYPSHADGEGGSADEALSRELGTVTVIGRRPTSLPTQIPTTIEGITRRGDRACASTRPTAKTRSSTSRACSCASATSATTTTPCWRRRASGTGNSARSLVYADGILLSNLLGNGATFTPRWGLVTPEEIERVDVLYGPFSAAYPGNSVGAVVDYVTRMPDELEAHAQASSSFGAGLSSCTAPKARYRAGRPARRSATATARWSWWIDCQPARQRRPAARLREQAREHRRRRARPARRSPAPSPSRNRATRTG